MTRIRVRYTKLGKVRFVGHRDVARIWERALRRAEVPVAYTEGFSPRPRLSFGLALPTGAESVAEYLDADLSSPADVDGLPARLDPCLPAGFGVQAAAVVEPHTPSLQQSVGSCTWRIQVTGVAAAELAGTVATLLEAEEVLLRRVRKGGETVDDIRPLVHSVVLTGATPTGTELVAELGAHPRALRPSELLLALGCDPLAGRLCRTHQWLLPDGGRREPLPLAGPWGASVTPGVPAASPPAPPAREARAS